MFGCIGVFVILEYFVFVDWHKTFFRQLLLLLLILSWDWLCVTIIWNPRAGRIWRTLSVQYVIQIVFWQAWLIHSSLYYFILLSCKTDARKLQTVFFSGWMLSYYWLIRCMQQFMAEHVVCGTRSGHFNVASYCFVISCS